MRRQQLLPAAFVLALLAEIADAQSITLVNVDAGEVTSDTGLGNQTKLEIVKTRGGKAMKVRFAAGDSIGQRVKIADWSPYRRLRFTVENPGKAVELEFNLLHGQSKDFQTRVVLPIAIKSGENEISIPLATLKNVNGSAPDLGTVQRWYLVDVNSQTPTLLFGSFALDDGRARPVRKPGAASPVHGDPARMARIRAAKLPKITKPTLFNTPEADAVMSALEIFPEDNAWNLLVGDWPLHPDSEAIIASIGAQKPLRYNLDMNFVLVPPNQPRVNVKLNEGAEESDKGPYPVPDNTPIEGWPAAFVGANKLSLDEVQRDKLNQMYDRHAIVLDPANRIAYEFYAMKRTAGGWTAAQASIFDLKTNKMRPDGWTSTDAAGLPLLPSVVRYDELKRGKVEHALRLSVPRSRRAYVHPATHHAGHADDPRLPRMGERLRLRKSFSIKGYSPAAATILQALKDYGAIVADNGLEWCVSVTPDPRIPPMHEDLRKIQGRDFEVIAAPDGYEPPRR